MASQNSVVVIGRSSYLNVWEKRAFDRGEPMYSMALLVSKRDKKTLAAIDKAVNAAIEIGKDKYWKGRVPQKFTYPMHDGDIEKPDQKAYRGMMFFNVKCYDEIRRLDEDGNDLYDQSRLYSGCLVRVGVTFSPFDKKGNAGVGAYFNIVKLEKQLEPLDGRMSVEELMAPSANEMEFYSEYDTGVTSPGAAQDYMANQSYANQNYGQPTQNGVAPAAMDDDFNSLL